uniref:MarR family winged helix-turn-helix transcriptional regulator n=2 Tax=Neorhizobium sp. EC2-8 TaxID=3129230 RepID=UPI0031017EB4
MNCHPACTARSPGSGSRCVVSWHSAKQLAEAEVTSQQYQAMLVIKTAAGGRIMMRELSEQMLMHPHGAVQLVDRLSLAGLANRMPSENDRRSVLIGLTPRGGPP